MHKNELLKIIEEKEWQKFLTRPYNLAFVSLHARAYHQELKDIVGNDCHTLYICNGEVVEIFRDEATASKIKRNFQNLSLQPLKLYETVINIMHYKILADKLVGINKSQSVEYFTHLTSLPFNLGNTIIDNKLHEKNINHKKILDILQEVRSLNYYYKFAEQYLKKQNKKFVYLAIGSRAYYSFDWQLIKQIKMHLIKANYLPLANEIKGTVAFGGLVRGRVRKIFSLSQSAEFFVGEILISHSTNPELLSIIKKAGAIVIDEGGMMSHAAILARELKIPCLVGTGMATKVFQDGDLVEVDAVNGVVKKL